MSWSTYGKQRSQSTLKVNKEFADAWETLQRNQTPVKKRSVVAGASSTAGKASVVIPKQKGLIEITEMGEPSDNYFMKIFDKNGVEQSMDGMEDIYVKGEYGFGDMFASTEATTMEELKSEVWGSWESCQSNRVSRNDYIVKIYKRDNRGRKPASATATTPATPPASTSSPVTVSGQRQNAISVAKGFLPWGSAQAEVQGVLSGADVSEVWVGHNTDYDMKKGTQHDKYYIMAKHPNGFTVFYGRNSKTMTRKDYGWGDRKDYWTMREEKERKGYREQARG